MLNNIRTLIIGSLLLLAAILLTGCASTLYIARKSDINRIIDAHYAANKVVLDGRLDEPVWRQAKTYPLRPMPKCKLIEPGWVRLAWDDQYLYLAVEFADTDVVAEGDKNGLMHFQLGDVCELFLKSDSDPGYWELYVTPRGHQSVFYFPSRGRRLPSCLESPMAPLKVAAQVAGTINSYRDKDTRWTAEMAVPWKILVQEAPQSDYVNLGPTDFQWRILIGRYNYSRYLADTELSCLPAISAVNFHLNEEYAQLRLKRNPTSR